MVSFGFPHQAISPQIASSTGAYPNRWTHHVLVKNAEAINETYLHGLMKHILFRRASAKFIAYLTALGQRAIQGLDSLRLQHP